jgi:hypothetical protein
MKPVLTSAVAVALLVMTAMPGGGQPPQDPTKDADYFPLKVNTVWTYEAAGGMLITVKVTKQEDKKVGEAMVQHSRLETSINNMVVSSEVVAILKQGVCRVAVADKPVTPPLCFLELPPKKGKKWKIPDKGVEVGGETITGAFEAGEEEVPAAMIPYYSKGEKDKKVKLDTVKSVDLKVNGQPMELKYYFASGVGMVKQVATIAGVQVDLNLKSLDVPKGQ